MLVVNKIRKVSVTLLMKLMFI